MTGVRAYHGTLLVCGGIYGNRQALEALLKQAAIHGVASHHIIITGDIAAYCADGMAVSAICRERLADALIIRGNCERALAANDDDCGCGFSPDSVCNLLSVAWYRHAAASIDDETKQWMGQLPPSAAITFGGRRLAVIHGGSDADNTFIFRSTGDKKRHIDALQADGVIAGHCGIPFTEQLPGQLWHNSGALGMPANDGTPRVWYSLLRESAAGIEISHCALEYDYSAAAAAMREAGLPPPYQQTLAGGIWPSDSVLPPAEKRQQGVCLPEHSVMWAAENKH